MHTGLSDILNYNERSYPILVDYMYTKSYRHSDLSIFVRDD